MSYAAQIRRLQGATTMEIAGSGILKVLGSIVGGMVGDAFYVDSGEGDDDNHGGTSWADAKATMAAAYALMTDGADDYLFIRGHHIGSLTVAKKQSHFVGCNPPGSKQYAGRLSANGDGPCLLIQAQDVEVANLNLCGNREAHHAAVKVDADNGGTRAFIHDNFIRMLTPSGTNYCNGVEVYGDRTVVRNNIIESCAVGIWVQSSVQATYENEIWDNVIYACNTGIYIQNVQEATGQHGVNVLRNIIDGQRAYAETCGIHVAASGGAPFLVENYIAGYTTDITKGSAKLILNYKEDIGGTKLT